VPSNPDEKYMVQVKFNAGPFTFEQSEPFTINKSDLQPSASPGKSLLEYFLYKLK